MNDDDKLTGLINAGADITGGVAGGVIGFLLAGPVGAIAGGASGPIVTSVLKKVGLEVKERLIGPREEKRVGATLAYSIEKIQTKLSAGERIRDDGFFDSSPEERSDADEVYEATILAAQREYQERKIKYYGNLVANISFDRACTKSQANHLINIAQALSWKQLCILALSGRNQDFNLRDSDYTTELTMGHDRIFLLDEIMELYNKSLIVFGPNFLMGMTNIHPSRMRLEGVGVGLYNMMELSTIPVQEIEEVAVLLR